jgi:transcriptional accessory protein Tex/SPT6
VNQLATAVVSESRVVTSILRSFPGLDQGALQSLVKLINGGMTMPFIARYRAMEIQPINEVQLRAIHRTYDDVMELEVSGLGVLTNTIVAPHVLQVPTMPIHILD